MPLPRVTNIKKKQSCRWGVLAKENLSTFSSTLPISKCSAFGFCRITSMVYTGRPFFGAIVFCCSLEVFNLIKFPPTTAGRTEQNGKRWRLPQFANSRSEEHTSELQSG